MGGPNEVENGYRTPAIPAIAVCGGCDLSAEGGQVAIDDGRSIGQ